MAASAKLIELVNKLQNVMLTIGEDPLDLPQIVVLGSQSAGKSSVLEALVGRDFLPRGAGIITRRPLVLQLINTSTQPQSRSTNSDSSTQEWGVFSHSKDQKFFDFSQIRREIEQETIRKTGNSKGISPEPIHLTLYSPNVLTLTLVDLPGLTKIAISDQPSDIAVQIRKLVLQYITKPNSVILAVSAANADIATSESLQMAKEVDPEGIRTIGVLTKLDLMDGGTEASAVAILTGHVVPLKHGFIGVVNRSQNDTDSNKPLRESLQSEEKFFRTHLAFARVQERCSTPNLAKMLQKLLSEHIRLKMPEIRQKLSLLLAQTQQELNDFGDPITSHSQQISTLLKQLSKFANDFTHAIDGSGKIATSALIGGARIMFIFNDIFGSTLQAVDPCAGLTVQDIRNAIRNSTGARQLIFVPEMAFEMLVKRQIQRLLEPSLRCVELVHDELIRITTQVELKDFSRFQTLRQKVTQTTTTFLRERLQPTTNMIRNLIDIELAFINTMHPDFVATSAAIQASESVRKRKNEIKSIDAHPSSENNSFTQKTASLSTMSKDAPESIGLLSYFFRNPLSSAAPKGENRNSFSSGSPSDDTYKLNEVHHKRRKIQRPVVIDGANFLSPREEMEIELIRALIFTYFDVVRRNIQDAVPKAVMHFLVNNVKQGLHDRLLQEVYHEDQVSTLLQEDASVAAERTKAQERLEVFQQATIIINDVGESMF